MCPEAEVKLREKERLLHPFEVVSGTDKYPIPKADRNKVVKEFTRSAAGKGLCKPEDVRSPPVLIVTVDYLLEAIATRVDVPWAEVYGFISNRLRAVRQDLVMQDIHDGDAVCILEKAVRFYLYAGYHLCEADIATFDASINATHLQECLKQLLRLYDLLEKANKKQQPTAIQDPVPDGHNATLWQKNRCEFESYYILYNLGEPCALQHFVQLPAELRNTRILNVAWQVSRCDMECNFVRLFRLASNDLSALQCCALHHHISRLWKASLRTYCAAFSNKLCRYPLGKYCQVHCIDREEWLARLANVHGCVCADGQLAFQKACWKENGEFPIVRLPLFDNKIGMTQLSVLLTGRTGS